MFDLVDIGEVVVVVVVGAVLTFEPSVRRYLYIDIINYRVYVYRCVCYNIMDFIYG